MRNRMMSALGLAGLLSATALIAAPPRIPDIVIEGERPSRRARRVHSRKTRRSVLRRASRGTGDGAWRAVDRERATASRMQRLFVDTPYRPEESRQIDRRAALKSAKQRHGASWREHFGRAAA